MPEYKRVLKCLHEVDLERFRAWEMLRCVDFEQVQQVTAIVAEVAGLEISGVRLMLPRKSDNRGKANGEKKIVWLTERASLWVVCHELAHVAVYADYAGRVAWSGHGELFVHALCSIVGKVAEVFDERFAAVIGPLPEGLPSIILPSKRQRRRRQGQARREIRKMREAAWNTMLGL